MSFKNFTMTSVDNFITCFECRIKASTFFEHKTTHKRYCVSCYQKEINK